MTCMLSHNQTPWLSELSEIVFSTAWLLHSAPHSCSGVSSAPVNTRDRNPHHGGAH